MPGSIKRALNVTHVFVCGYAPASLPSGQFIAWIYLKPNYFYSFTDQNVTLLPSSVDDDPWPSFCSLILGEKSRALGKQQMSVFSKCLRPSFPLHFYPFLPQSHPRPLCFCFFPTVPCSICCEKASRAFWGQIKRGNESRQKRETGIKNWMKKNIPVKGYFYQDDTLKEQCGTFPNYYWRKTNELKEIPEEGLKNKNLSTQNKEMWTLHDDPSLSFILPLLWPSVFPELSLSTSWGLAAVPSLSKLLGQVRGARTTKLQEFVIRFALIKKWNPKSQNAVTSGSHFSPLLILFTSFLPFSNSENLHRSVQITASFHYGKPQHPYSCISLLLVYTLSTLVHPVWAGMENPTSVYTEAHSSSTFEIGQRATNPPEESLRSLLLSRTDSASLKFTFQ